MNPRANRIPLPPGQMIDVGGFQLHTVVSGQGSPCIVLETGLGGCTLQFAALQPALSTFARVVAYDRAGQAWSDPSPSPRTPANLVGELRTMLGRLDLQPPYILAGHSFGGLLSLIHAGFHPGDTAAVVLIDSSDVEQYESFPSMDKVVGQAATGVRLLKIASRLGLARQLTRLSLGPAARSFTKEQLDAFLDVSTQPKHHESVLAEFAQHPFYFGAQSQVPRSLGDTPLLVITAGQSVSGRQRFGNMTADQLNVKHQHWQKERTRLSTRGEQCVVAGASHLGILLQPGYVAQVADAIHGLVQKLRAQQPLPA